MELELTRVDYTIVGVTGCNCLTLLPNSLPKEPQKVVVADTEGILQVFSIKKEDVILHFKTLPGAPITSVQTAGAIGTANDKIFVASENEVRGYTKKGKLFLTFDSGMTENIISMFVLGNDLFLCGNHIYNHYRDCKEVGSYLCGDRIINVTAFYLPKTKRLMALLACEGRVIRALEHARVTFSIVLEHSPTLFHIFENDDNRSILFGTIDGRIGVINSENSPRFEKWLVENDGNTSKITCMDSYDMNGNGIKNLIVGKEDGCIEVYDVTVLDGIDVSAVIYSFNCNESITAIKCGVVGSQGFDEIVVVSFSGRIFGLTTQTIDENLEINEGNYIFPGGFSHKITKLKNEIEEIQVKVQKEREKYQSSTISIFDELSAIPLLSLKDSFVLSKESGTYCLTIEVTTAIDNILLQSDVPLYLMDVEKNSAVVSHSDSDLMNGNFLLATYRCQINTNRLELLIRTVEGQRGTLNAFVTPLIQPKCSRLMQYEIKCLSLHYRVHEFDSNRPINVLTLKGTFSLAEIHTWISQCLSEVPEKPQVSEKNVLWFKSALLGTALQCSYQKGEAEFRSDNISTVSILKEFLTVMATKKKIKIEINLSINEDSIDHTLKLIEPKLVKYQKLAKDLAILDAVNELEVTAEEESSYLSKKYRKLLSEDKALRLANQKEPGYLDRLYGAINDLYVDFNKLKGSNIKSKIPQLLEILEHYSYESLLQFFRPNSQ